MLSKEDFVRRILDGAPAAPAQPEPDNDAGSLPAGFDDFEEPATPASTSTDTRFAQLLLEESGFGRGETLPRNEIVLGDQKTNRFLPGAVTYWAKTPERPFHIILFDLEIRGKKIMADAFFRQNDQLEDALHRIVQDALDGFERGGAGRTADKKQGDQTETLCVVSVLDDRRDSTERQIVCFGTKCTATNALEVFSLREEVRDWDRPLAEEHVEQLFKRHFRKLADGQKWQEAFVSGPERAKAEALLKACSKPDLSGKHQKTLKEAVFLLLDQLALSFGVGRTKQYNGQPASLMMEDLPPHHSLAVDPDASRKKGFVNRLKGVRIFDASDRLLGYIVYVVDKHEDRDKLRNELKQNNHFHNVLVIYPDENGGALELWQGDQPLRGRLTAGGSRTRFDGVGGIVQLLSRFFVVSRSAIETPEQLARELAWRARHLKSIALDELKREIIKKEGPLYELFRDFNLALAQQEPEQFADTYAQTITYGMLAARWLARDKLTRFTRREAMKLLPSTSEFLKDLFNRLINNEYDTNLTWLLDDITSLLSRTLVREVFHGEKDPSIHFYQDFLDAYDATLRRRMGVYYTPDEVVEYIVTSLDHLAKTRLELRLGLADPIRWGEYAKQRGIPLPDGIGKDDFVVQILDPATGTGTFLLHTVELIFRTMTAEYSRLGYDDNRAASEWKKYVRESLLPRVNAFELMMAPYIVAHLRLGLALEQGLAEQSGRDPANWGFVFGKKDRLRVFLTNTLELHAKHQLDWLSSHVAEEGREAEKLKKEMAILVVMGNPPYERVSADTDTMSEWLLKGKVPGRKDNKSLFDDILDVARENTIFSHHASLYDRYVYFWRWALWKTFEQNKSLGLVSLITNSTWLSGPGFVGLRQLVRQLGDEIWTLDLGGDNRGTNPEPNVFNIETPVAITLLTSDANSDKEQAAIAHYQKINGSSAGEKLSQVNALLGSAEPPCGTWKAAGHEWLESLIPPTGDANWLDMPALTDLLPWQQPGCKFGRLWPISPSRNVLEERWRCFTAAAEPVKPRLFYTGTSGRNIYTNVRDMRRLVDEKPDSPSQPIQRYGYRSFDRQYAFNDPRMAKTESPSLWRSLSENQVFFTTMITKHLGGGPTLTCSAYIPDLDYYCGRGGKDILPLYRDSSTENPNLTMGLLRGISAELGKAKLGKEDIPAYIYALLSNDYYQIRFAEELKTPGPRVPITRDPALWKRAVTLGKKLIWLHTYAERLRAPAEGRGDTLPTAPGLKWTAAVTRMPEKLANIKYDPANQTLMVGNGIVSGVRQDVMDFSVSGMKVVSKWLGYRTAKGAGKAASSSNPLDKIRLTEWPEEWNRELIELLTVLTITLDMQPELATLLDAICDGPLISASELPKPTAAERKEPKLAKHASGPSLFDEE